MGKQIVKPIRCIILKPVAAIALSTCLVGGLAFAADATSAPSHGEETVYATVNGKPILIRDYAAAFNATLRQKFYHGKVPDGQMVEVREQVTNQMVQRMLLVDEAKKRGIVPDNGKITEQIAGYEAQYKNSQAWQQNRERLLPGLHAQLSEQSLFEQLERSVRKVPEPMADEVRAFYDSHQALFTEPEKLHLSAILLTVDPSAPKAVWDQARSEASAIHARLLNGADFAETARLHSSGKEAERGGDLGYVHRGMLPEALEQKIDEFTIGVPAEPLTLLEGVAIFRLDERKTAKLRAFEDVSGRARDLARRDREEAAWASLMTSLRSAAEVKILVSQSQSEGGGERR
jgi:parvulin-like peptidyl-prolyl isomerase